MATWRRAALALVVGSGPVGFALAGAGCTAQAVTEGGKGNAGAKSADGGKAKAGKSKTGPPGEQAGDDAGPPDSKDGGGKDRAGKDGGAPALVGGGKVLPNAPLDLLGIIGGDPKTAESHLGDPIAKGMMKESCLRFVPDKTWFKCEWVWQRYADKTSTYAAIEVTYEDGKAVSVTMEKIPGKGEFDPKIALGLAGLELPGTPKVTEPGEDAKVWSYFNSEAQLVIHGRQYRVRVSAIGGRWETSKVEVILNDPLSPDEKSRVFEVGPPADAPKPE